MRRGGGQGTPRLPAEPLQRDSQSLRGSPAWQDCGRLASTTGTGHTSAVLSCLVWGEFVTAVTGNTHTALGMASRSEQSVSQEILKEAFCEEEKSCLWVLVECYWYVLFSSINSNPVLLICQRKERACFCRPSLKKLTVMGKGRASYTNTENLPILILVFPPLQRPDQGVRSARTVLISVLKLILPP